MLSEKYRPQDYDAGTVVRLQATYHEIAAGTAAANNTY